MQTITISSEKGNVTHAIDDTPNTCATTTLCGMLLVKGWTWNEYPIDCKVCLKITEEMITRSLYGLVV